MSQDKDDINQFNADDFERYYSGRMSEQEMHVLEKAALEDPFLGDAFEGYVYTASPVQDIRELKERLGKRDTNKKVIWLRRKRTYQFLKIAAILILFAGFSWMIYKENADPPQPGVMVAKKESVSEFHSDHLSPIPPSDTSFIISGNNTGYAGATTRVQTELKGTTSFLTVSDSTEIARNDQHATYSQSFPPVAIDDKKLESTAETPERKFYATNKALAGKDAEVQLRQEPVNINGRIIDNTGMPVPFATITEKGVNSGVQADKDGAFSYKVKDTASQLVVNAVGYRPVTISSDSSTYDIVLQKSDNSLNEVVVSSAFQTKRKQSTTISVRSVSSEVVTGRVTVKNAEPVQGWAYFNSYVTDSLKNTLQLNSSPIHGKVIMSFDLNNNGKPIKVKIKKHLCSACDAEAIRIIKSQSWKWLGPEKKAEATIFF